MSTRKRKTIGGGGSNTPAICIPIAGRNMEEIRAQAEAAAREAPDLLEWRADYFPDIRDAVRAAKALAALRAGSGALPVLFACRRKEEGGLADLGPEEYGAILDWAIARADIDRIDIEALQSDFDPQRHIAAARREGKTTIASAHFFDRMPGEAELTEIFARLEDSGAEILKLAAMAGSESDAHILMRAAEKYRAQGGRPLIPIAMGEAGVITRGAWALAHAAITFVAAEKSTAPGQLPAHRAREFLRGENKG